MMEKTGRYEFLTEPFHCDFSNRIFMGHLGNSLLNAADYHSNDRGFGMNYLNVLHRTWVLSRLSIEMEEMPLSYSRYVVETWVENVMRFFTNRNFKVTSADGSIVYGYGRSVWAMIDTDTRQPVDLTTIHDGLIFSYVEKEKGCPIAPISRVKMSANTELVREIDTFYNDVDVNGHINSVKYIEHVLDLWDVDWYRFHSLHRIEIAYVAEAHGGDKLAFYREQLSDGSYAVRIMKREYGTGNLMEVVRCRVVFRPVRISPNNE